MARTTIIEDKFAAWLATIPAVVTNCRANGVTRVYPFMVAPQNGLKPYVTFHRLYGHRQRTLKGPTTRLMHACIQVDVWGSYTLVKAVADAIRQAVDSDLPQQWVGANGTLEDTDPGDGSRVLIQSAEVSDDRDMGSPPQHGDELPDLRVSLDCELWFEEG